MKLRVLIVEDEPLARGRLRNLLEAEADVEVIETCENGKVALQVLQSSLPNVVFLDVQMPEMDGFAFLQAIPLVSRPIIIIVTGHEKHARKAFDVQAVDFLLKPFDRERFRLTLQRARERIHNSRRLETDDVVKALRQMLDTAGGITDRIAIKNNGRVIFVTPTEIDWIDAVGNYCQIHAGHASHMILSTLTALEKRLPGQEFLRISRSTIINVNRLKEVRFHHGGCTAILADGTERAVSGRPRRTLDRLIGK